MIYRLFAKDYFVQRKICKCYAPPAMLRKLPRREMQRGKRPVIGGWKELGYTEEEWLSFSRGKRWRLRNPDKMKAATRSWYDRNKDKAYDTARISWLKNSYGLTVNEYEMMLLKQDSRCAICRTDKPTGKWKVFAVDHCHKTGKVRGLLCNECNRGMGLLKDSPVLLRLAAEYIDNHDAKTLEERRNKDA